MLRRRFSHSPKDSPAIVTLSAIYILRMAKAWQPKCTNRFEML
jgi:hypothetical protein